MKKSSRKRGRFSTALLYVKKTKGETMLKNFTNEKKTDLTHSIVFLDLA